MPEWISGNHIIVEHVQISLCAHACSSNLHESSPHPSCMLILLKKMIQMQRASQVKKYMPQNLLKRKYPEVRGLKSTTILQTNSMPERGKFDYQ